MDRDRSTLLDIAKAARLTMQFVEGSDRSEFLEDIRTQSAVLHQLLVIGEATKRLSPGFREENDSVPWKLMAGMRDKLIHEYDDVDLHEVWKTATNDVRRILSQIEPLLPRQEG